MLEFTHAEKVNAVHCLIDSSVASSGILVKTSDPTLELIAEILEDYTGITVDQIKSKSRVREVTQIRQLLCYLAGELTNDSLKQIGRFINRDHSTVIHSKRTTLDLLETDRKVRNKFYPILAYFNINLKPFKTHKYDY